MRPVPKRRAAPGTVPLLLVAATIVATSVRAEFPAGEGSLAGALRGEEALTETQKIVHVLNRLGYGPAPGDIERVRQMGIDAYIEEQLWPEAIDDSAAEARVARYRALEMDLEELRETFQPVAPQARRARAEGRQIREALNEGRPDRVGLTMPGEPVDARAYRQLAKMGRPGDYEIFEARWLRAAFSRRQLLEMMVDFWANHFSMQLGDHYYATHYEQQVVRPLALGRFEDLLMATAKHPSMLEYLDNWLSAAPAEVLEERIEKLRDGTTEDRLELRRRIDFLRSATGLNENYARELMELHTLGVDGGYTQQDVIEVARAFTGWTIAGGIEEEGEFAFDPLMHEEGDKTVLGRIIESGGIEEGEEIIRMLARHPSTARFVSTKLVRRFVADDPPEAIVEAAAETFLRTDGDIREVLRTIFTSPDFFAPEHYGAKIKKPIELVASSLRAVGAEFDTYLALPTINRTMRSLGEELYGREAPDGYPDYAAAWLNTNALLHRLGFAFDVATGELAGLEVDLEAGRELLREMGMPEPTAEEIAASQRFAAMAERLREQEAAEGEMQGEMTQQQMTDPSMMAMGGAASDAEVRSPFSAEQLAVATMLGSPSFQKR